MSTLNLDSFEDGLCELPKNIIKPRCSRCEQDSYCRICQKRIKTAEDRAKLKK